MLVSLTRQELFEESYRGLFPLVHPAPQQIMGAPGMFSKKIRNEDDYKMAANPLKLRGRARNKIKV